MTIIPLVIATTLTLPNQASAADHWAYQPPTLVIPSEITAEARNPIDAFIFDIHRQHRTTAVEPVEDSLALRRLYLSLTGLPPTPIDRESFLTDPTPDAWERTVDRLLASPRHADRWARHWMDIWRYADWYGLGAQLRNSQKHIWHWRDWIRESLDDGVGYDRMVREMLAADEIAPDDLDTLRATGFLARNYFLFNRTTWLDDTVEHTAKAFLGVTMNCAKCHDHKYDPITHEDYYRYRAIFEPHQIRLDTLPGTTDLERNGLPRAFDAHPDAKTFLHIRGEEQSPDPDTVIEPGIPESFAFGSWKVTPIDLPATAHTPALRQFVLRDHLQAAEEQLRTARLAMKEATIAAAREKESPQPAPKGELVLSDTFEQARPELWEAGSGEWSYADGRLIQKATGDTRRYYRTRHEHPRDFEATLRFRTLDGERWKSVGLCFDVGDDRDVLVYMSAAQSGSKVQVAINQGGNYVYPKEGLQNRPVELNTWYELTVTVRDRLVNVAIDGQHALAYRLSKERRPGRLDLISFDAAVEFDALEVRTVGADVPLREPGAGSPLTPQDAETQLALARARLTVAECTPEALRTADAANRAQMSRPTPANLDELIKNAAQAARRLELAQAELAVVQAEAELAKADEKTRSKQETDLKNARNQVTVARKRLEDPGTSYSFPTASIKALEGPDETAASRNAPYPHTSTGRRTALANWITDRANPLTARVTVNHIWMRHLGQPIVEPVNDFGPRTPEPPLRSVLDSLAVRFVDHDWDMKWLHREIVTSATYRLRTGPDTPSPLFAWRRPGRVESEAIRDGMLHLAGSLDETLGGPPVDPNGGSRRRGLYLTHSRDVQDRFLNMFDHADILRCYRREESIVPQQALALANGRLPLEMSRRLATQLGHAGDSLVEREAFVRSAFETILTRSPTDEELQVALDTVDRIGDVLKDRPDREHRARAALILALFNHNDFVTLR